MSYHTTPVPFDGTLWQRSLNRATHDFHATDEGDRCVRCDARITSVAVDYPCGTPVPTLTQFLPDPAENPWIDGGLDLAGR